MIGKVTELIPRMLKLPEDKQYEVKEYSGGKRTLNANNYAWALMGKIAESLNITKDEVYECMLQDYGSNYEENDEIVTISSAKELKSNKHLHVDLIGSSVLNDKTFYHYRLIKGSSEYTKREMYKFSMGVRYEADSLGIETRTPEEIAKMADDWKPSK